MVPPRRWTLSARARTAAAQRGAGRRIVARNEGITMRSRRVHGDPPRVIQASAGRRAAVPRRLRAREPGQSDAKIPTACDGFPPRVSTSASFRACVQGIDPHLFSVLRVSEETYRPESGRVKEQRKNNKPVTNTSNRAQVRPPSPAKEGSSPAWAVTPSPGRLGERQRIEPGPRLRADWSRPNASTRHSWLRLRSNPRDNFSVKRRPDSIC